MARLRHRKCSPWPTRNNSTRFWRSCGFWPSMERSPKSSAWNKAFDEHARARGKPAQPVAGGEEDALVRAIRPVRDSPIAGFAEGPLVLPRIEGPAQRTGGGIQRDQLELGRGGVEQPIHDDGIAVHFGILESVAGVVGPRDFEAGDGAAIDLVGGRIADAVRAAAVDGPLAIRFDGLEGGA